MLFWTIVFFTMNLIFLVRNPFQKLTIAIGELTIKKEEGDITEEEFKEKTKSYGFLFLFLILPLIIGEIIYYICAIKIDPVIYPTVFVLAFCIFNSVFSKSKQHDLITEDGRKKYRKQLYKGKTIRNYITNIIYCGYILGICFMYWCF